ncbi:hypothetical protein ACFL96_16145 [Thermoproteota archaeon]
MKYVICIIVSLVIVGGSSFAFANSTETVRQLDNEIRELKLQLMKCKKSCQKKEDEYRHGMGWKTYRRQHWQAMIERLKNSCQEEENNIKFEIEQRTRQR